MEKWRKRNRFNIFVILKDLLRFTNLSQCDCKYHFYGNKLGISSPDIFFSSFTTSCNSLICIQNVILWIFLIFILVFCEFLATCAGGFRRRVSHTKSCIKTALAERVSPVKRNLKTIKDLVSQAIIKGPLRGEP